MSVRGHLWTAWPVLRHRVKPWTAPPSEPWSMTIEDSEVGPVKLSGRLSVVDPRRVLVLVHGLGGCADSVYQHRACEMAQRLGLSTFRFEMRGSDRRGEDIYHAGLSSDLGEALRSPAFQSFEDVYLVGFSVGGHVALHYATTEIDPRLRAVAAVSAPLDLEATVEHFDQPHRVIYQRYVLSGLKDLYRQVAARREMAVPVERVLEVKGLREWDQLTVVPRFGFGDTDTYYREASVANRLDELQCPALLVAGEGDPMVTADSVRRGLGESRPRGAHDLRVAWVKGAGHVAFPSKLDLGVKGPLGLDGQVQSWLLEH